MTRVLTITLAVLVALGCGSRTPPPDEKARTGGDLVRQLTEQFYRGELDPLFARFSDEMKQTLPRHGLAELHHHVETQFGKEIAVLGEEFDVRNGYRAFVRWARFDRHDGVIEIQWILRPDDSIAGLFVRPAAQGPEVAVPIE